MTATIKPDFKDSVVLRIARKEHHCCGGHDGQQRTRCQEPILPGERYAEYYGASPAYQSGDRYHLLCASEQGLIELSGIREACSRQMERTGA